MKKLTIALYIAVSLLCLVVLSSSCKQQPEYPHRVSLEEADEIIDAPLPMPDYLPNGFEVKGIYVLENSEFTEIFTVLISDEAFDEETLSAKMELKVTLYRRGQMGGLKLVGERFDIGETQGVLVIKETTSDLWWILPYPEYPGQYEISLAAIKEIPKEELVKIAESVNSK